MLRSFVRCSKPVLAKITTPTPFNSRLPLAFKRNLSNMVEDVEAKKPRTEEKTIGTHDGTFHCDEILACFMLQQLPEYSNARIVRSRDLKKLEPCDVVVDVGAVFDPEKKRFDHHQREFKETLSSLRPELPGYDVKLSSAGLVFVFYGEEVIKEILKKHAGAEVDPKILKVMFKKVYKGLIEEIDGIDNGVPQYDGEPKYKISTNLSSRVGNFNRTWNSTEAFDEMSQFEKAKEMVGSELLDKVLYYWNAWWPARKLVQEAIDNRFKVHESGEILELSHFCPWKQHLGELEEENDIVGVPKYVLFEDKPGDYRVIAVPVTPESFVSRKALHKDMRGIRDEELAQVSGIPTARFCHASGFIGGASSSEGALQMAIRSLEGDYTD